MNLLLVIQEYVSFIIWHKGGSKKRIELLRHHVDPKSSDVILDVGEIQVKYQQRIQEITAETFLYWGQKTKM